MGAEDAFDHVPSNVTEVRYEDAFFGFKKGKGNKLDVYAKNVQTDYRLHLYINDNDQGAVITKEPTATTQKEHGQPFTFEKLMQPFIKPLEELLAGIEHVSLEDRRFKGKTVYLASIHRIRFIQTRRGMAYFEPDMEYRECKFEDIDRSLQQVGVMKGWFGRELALVFVGRGEVYILNMKHVVKCTKRLKHELAKTGLDKLVPM